MNKSIYLCGSMSNLVDFGSRWRTELTPWLINNDWRVYDPCKEEASDHKAYRVKDKEKANWEKLPQKLQEKIILKDLEQIKRRTKFIICFFTQYSTGTVSELSFAAYHGIPIYFVSSLKLTGWPSTIARMHGNKLFRTFKQLKLFLVKETL